MTYCFSNGKTRTLQEVNPKVKYMYSYSNFERSLSVINRKVFPLEF